MIRPILFALPALIIFSGCSTYQLSSEKKETLVDKISPNAITVTFCGNAFMNKAEVEKYALQRAARESLSKGCPYFVVLKKEDNSKFCSIDYAKRGQYTPNVPPTENLAYPAPAEFSEPNIKLTIQCIQKGEKIPEKAINAEEYLKNNFPGLQE